MAAQAIDLAQESGSLLPSQSRSASPRAAGTATVRRRRLPAEEVVWVVLGIARFRDRPIEDVVSKLDLALPGGGGTVARSSVSEARARLGRSR
jgi:hypothetical protein